MKCNGSACRLCDFTSGYTLNGSDCTKITLENCVTMNQRGRCLTCDDGFYIDPSTSKCVAVATNDLIQNCRTYTGPSNCSVCSTGFYLNNGACVAIDSPIQNCDVQNNTGVCLLCKSGFYLSLDNKSCQAGSTNDNCASYTNIECSSCGGGFIKNLNNYLYQFINLTSPNFENDVTNMIIQHKNNDIDGKNLKVCQSVQLSNCASFEAFNKCRTCSLGYFLDNNKRCVKYPFETIVNCEVYTSLLTCAVCKPGFYLEGSNACIEVPAIDNCEAYSNKDNSTDCVKCIEGFYLITFNTCVPRKNTTIANCVTLQANAEACGFCNVGYRATDDGSKCLSIIANCSVYEPSNVLSTDLKCYRCNNGYYYEVPTNSCLVGAVANCEIFEKRQNVCSKCVDKFYLEGDVCKAHDILLNCEVYHPTLKNICASCDAKTFLFEKDNQCVSVSPIPNCKVYNSRTTCENCDDGYYLSNNNCLMIPVSENCLQRRGTKCGKCIKDFILENGICRDSLDYIVNECEQDNVDGTVNFSQSKCHMCKQNTFPLSYENAYVCVETHYMTTIRNGVALTTNCTHYAPLANGSYECTRCVDGRYLDNGACVLSCTDAARSTLYRQIIKVSNTDGDKHNESFYIDRVNVCWTTIPGCAIATPNITQNKIELLNYQCVKCNDNRIARVEFGTDMTLITDPNDANNPFGDSPLSRAPGLECYDPTLSSAKMVGDVNAISKKVSFCDYYKKWGSITGCMKCSHGYTGVVLDVVSQCDIYINDAYTCKQCKQGYYLASAYECKQAVEIEFCTSYSTTSNTTTCTQCTNARYLSGNTCALRVNSLNVLNSTLVVNADNITCSTGYFKDTGSSPFKCVLMNTNCINGTIVATLFVCNECDHTKSYFDSVTKLCIIGSKSNCKTYNNTQNLCIECNNNFYLSNGSCIANTSGDTNCVTWSGSTRNACTTCNNSSILFTVSNKCRAVTTAITNCLEYDSLTTCSICADGTRLENLKTRCLTIPPSDNCAISTVMDYNQNSSIDVGDAPTVGANAGIFFYTCDKCTNNTSKHTRNNVTASNASSLPRYECFTELSYKLEQCATNNITGTQNFAAAACTSCNTGYYPRDWKDKYMCLESTYFSLKTSVSISNCERLQWDSTDNKYVCTRCTYPYFLQTDKTCAATCAASTHGVFSHFTTAADGTDTVVALSEPDSSCVTDVGAAYLIDNCLIYSTIFDYSDMACIKCNAGFIPVINYANSPALVDGYTSTTGRPVSPISVHPVITECAPVSYNNGDGVYIKGDLNFTTSLVNNCKYYVLLETEANGGNDDYHYGCVRCDYGYTGKVLNYTHSDTTTLSGYIKNCAQPTGAAACSTSYTDKDNAIGLGLSPDYINAHLGLTKYFSCLSCTTTGYIPFAFVESGAAQYNISKLLSYNINLTGSPYDAGITDDSLAGDAIQCINAYNGAGASIISTILGTTDNSFPGNCALGVLNIDSDGDSTDSILGNHSVATKLAAYCVACKPGFAPTYIKDDTDTTTIYQVVNACTAITNCTTAGSWFNSCADCIHYYDIYTNTIDYTKCVTGPTNCFAAYEVGPCVICKKGYDKNANGVCVQEFVPKCSQPNNNRNYRYYFDDKAVDIGITSAFFYGESEEPGCRSCPANYLLTKINHNAGTLYDTNLSKYVCNDFKSEPNHADKPTEANCATYGIESGNIVCKSCSVNYILTENFKCKLATISNCNVVKATDGYTCVSCANGYFNVGGRCYDVTTLIENKCASFDDSSLLTFAKCNACKDGYILRADGSWCDTIDATLYPNCVALTGGVCTKCSSLYALTTLASGTKYCYPIYTGANIQFDTNCLTVNETSFNNKQMQCTKCKTNFIIETGNTDYPTHCAAFFRNVVDNCSEYYSTGALSAATLKCKTCANVSTHYYKTATFECIARTAVANCATYETTYNRCSVCSDNYLLSQDGLTCSALPGAILTPNRAPNGGYIQKCLAMSTCSSKVIYSGLSAHLSSIFSCHKCSSNSLIPLAVVRAGETFGNIEGLQEFGLDPTAAQRYDTKTGESAITCVSTSRTTFNIDNGKFNFPTNCGAAILNANSVADATSSASTTNVDKTKVAVMCVACAPGYAPATATDAGGAQVPYMVASCTLITNCESSLWFSACSQCKSNFSYGYTEGLGVLYDRCISNTANPNCYAVDNSDASNLKCRFCRKGYYLNKDGYCELLHPPRCGYAEFRFRQYYSSFNLASGLFLSNNGIGCQKCDDGFVGLLNAAGNKQICTQSPYHTNGLVISTSKFIANCKNYAVGQGNDHKCEVCLPNYVLTVEGKCVINTNISNCRIGYSADSCFRCNQPFVLVDRKCVAGTIVNCKEYGNNEVYDKQICTQCDEGYYLKDNLCASGAITNCKSYDGVTVCSQCIDGYGLVKSKDGINYCYPIDTSLNCAELDYDNLQNGRLQCKSCKSNDFILSTDQNLYNRNLCMPFISLDNCLEYDRTPNIQDSSFRCAVCADGFYLKNGVCNIRTISFPECRNYARNEDKCLECAQGFFLESESTKCTAFPDGIAGCKFYLSKNTCLSCKSDMFLKDNTCLLVDLSDRQDDCVYYDDPQTCSECRSGFIVVDGRCEATLAKGCATYENINACESCPDGFGLKLESGLLNCVLKNVPNCLVSEVVEPYDCLVCNSGFYVNAGLCAAVTTPITSCIEYDGADVCAQCSSGSVLSADSRLCLKTTEVISVLDTNCTEAKLTDELVCNSCKPGYIFVNGVCSTCSKRSIAKGCYVCDPDNENTCLMCASGYYQYNDGRCVKNGLKPDEQEKPDDLPDSFALMKAVALVIIMMIFV